MERRGANTKRGTICGKPAGTPTSAAGAIVLVPGRLGEDERERIRAEIADQLGAFGGTGEIELPATSLVGSAS